MNAGEPEGLSSYCVCTGWSPQQSQFGAKGLGVGGCYSNLHFTSEDRRNLVLIPVKGGSRGTWIHEQYFEKCGHSTALISFFFFFWFPLRGFFNLRPALGKPFFVLPTHLIESFLPQLIFPRNTLMDLPRIMS